MVVPLVVEVHCAANLDSSIAFPATVPSRMVSSIDRGGRRELGL